MIKDNWTLLSPQSFQHGFTSLFIVKSERFYDYLTVTIFLGKSSNFLVTAPSASFPPPYPNP